MGNIPFAPRSSYDWRGSGTIRDLLLMQGDQRARMAQEAGDRWANYMGIISNTANQAAGMIQQKQEEKKIAKRDEAELGEVSSWDGKDSNELFKRLAPISGVDRAAKLTAAAHGFKTKTNDPMTELKGMRAGLQYLLDSPDTTSAALFPKAKERWGSTVTEKLGIPPEALEGEWGPDKRESLPRFLKAIDSYIGTKPSDVKTHVVGGALVDDSGKVIYQGADKPKLHKVTVPGPGGPVEKLVTEEELLGGVKTYQADKTPSFQAKEVLNDEGKPVMANFDARTGRYLDSSTGQAINAPRPVPTAAETQDTRKFKQAAPILKSVSELSEKINTLQGIAAKASGELEIQKAKVNLNDNVAEYEALISGFTPLVARALGHTGVLTEQDVQSAKALFPRPGDSKSLRDRKVARINSIIGQLEGAAPAGSALSGDQIKSEAERLKQLYGVK